MDNTANLTDDKIWAAVDTLRAKHENEVSQLRRDLETARSSHDMQMRNTTAFKRERDEAYAALRALGAIGWRINDTVDRSDDDQYRLASTSDWDALNKTLHEHAETIQKAQDDR